MNFLPFAKRKDEPQSSSGVEVGTSERKPLLKSASRNLLSRLHSCTLARDIRETLNDLRSCADLSECIGPNDIRLLLDVSHNFENDEDIVSSVLRVLCIIMRGLDDSSEIRLSSAEKNRKRARLSEEIAEETPWILDNIKNGKRSTQENSVELLRYVVENDYNAVRSSFLSPQVCTMLVEIATKEKSKVQSDAVQLLLLLTTTDPELHVLFALENIFKMFFSFISQSGGADGPPEVAELLNIVRNIVRQNQDGQEVFVSCGCLSFIANFFNGVISQLQKEWRTNDEKMISKPIVGSESSTVNLLNCLQVTNTFLDGVDPAKLSERKKKFLEGGIFESIACLALCGAAVDDAVRIAALRTLGGLLMDSGENIEAFLNLDVISVINESHRLIIWSAMRGLLDNLLSESCDPSLLNATLNAFAGLLSVERCLKHVTVTLFKGVTTSKGGKGDLTECSQLFIEVILGDKASSTSKYYAAHLLRMIVSSPIGAEKVLSLPVGRDRVSPALRLPDAKGREVPFFEVYAAYTINTLRGGSRGLNSTTLSAYISVLFFWMETQKTGIAVEHIFNDHFFKALLQLATAEGSVHVRFWCGALAASMCFHVGEEKGLTYQREFDTQLGGTVFFNNILFDVNASTSQWGSPTSSVFACGHSLLYDEKFVAVLKRCVDQFKVKSRCNTTNASASHVIGENLANPERIFSKDDRDSLLTKIESLQEIIQHQQEQLQRKDQEIERLRVSLENAEMCKGEGVPDSAGSQCRDVNEASRIAEMEETIQILEQQLISKDEQRQELLDIIKVMESQVQTSCGPLQTLDEEVESLKKELDTVRQERDDALILVGKMAMECNEDLKMEPQDHQWGAAPIWESPQQKPVDNSYRSPFTAQLLPSSDLSSVLPPLAAGVEQPIWV